MKHQNRTIIFNRLNLNIVMNWKHVICLEQTASGPALTLDRAWRSCWDLVDLGPGQRQLVALKLEGDGFTALTRRYGATRQRGQLGDAHHLARWGSKKERKMKNSTTLSLRQVSDTTVWVVYTHTAAWPACLDWAGPSGSGRCRGLGSGEPGRRLRRRPWEVVRWARPSGRQSAPRFERWSA